MRKAALPIRVLIAILIAVATAAVLIPAFYSGQERTQDTQEGVLNATDVSAIKAKCEVEYYNAPDGDSFDCQVNYDGGTYQCGEDPINFEHC